MRPYEALIYLKRPTPRLKHGFNLGVGRFRWIGPNSTRGTSVGPNMILHMRLGCFWKIQDFIYKTSYTRQVIYKTGHIQDRSYERIVAAPWCDRLHNVYMMFTRLLHDCIHGVYMSWTWAWCSYDVYMIVTWLFTWPPKDQQNVKRFCVSAASNWDTHWHGSGTTQMASIVAQMASNMWISYLYFIICYIYTYIYIYIYIYIYSIYKVYGRFGAAQPSRCTAGVLNKPSVFLKNLKTTKQSHQNLQ
jgi:hypothetical protein